MLTASEQASAGQLVQASQLALRSLLKATFAQITSTSIRVRFAICTVVLKRHLAPFEVDNLPQY